jgi:hypothetical protein
MINAKLQKWCLVSIAYWIQLPYYARKVGMFDFFAYTNPGLRMGGVLNYSKIEVLKKLNNCLLQIPITRLLPHKTPMGKAIMSINTAGLTFPFIIKPDIGAQNVGVAKIDTVIELATYLQSAPTDVLIQQIVEAKFEFAAVWYRLPNAPTGKILGLALRSRDKNNLANTTCLNLDFKIDDRLHQAFEPLTADLTDVFFGRFDLIADSVEAIREGKFHIVEMNGAFAMPLQLYDVSMPFRTRIRGYSQHWAVMAEIVRQNVALNVVAQKGSIFDVLHEALIQFLGRHCRWSVEKKSFSNS